MAITGAAVCAGGKPRLKFTYSGDYVVRDDGVVELRSTGTLVFLSKAVIDLFLVGGGGAAGTPPRYYGTGAMSSGAGGGYTATYKKITVQEEVAVTVGAGGLHNTSVGEGNPGGVTSFGTYSVNGGSGSPSDGVGGNGGSGGGGQGKSSTSAGAGGANGNDGIKGTLAGGTGQGTTTREFGEAAGKLYAGGGGGGAYNTSGGAGGSGGGGAGGANNANGASGEANTGGGGGGAARGGSTPYYGGDGGSGIVCFRLAA